MISFLNEFWLFLRVRKKYWLLPVFLVMALFGGLLVLAKGSAVAPFIYTIFGVRPCASSACQRFIMTARPR
jgi:hypothetical protein